MSRAVSLGTYEHTEGPCLYLALNLDPIELCDERECFAIRYRKIQFRRNRNASKGYEVQPSRVALEFLER